MNSHSHDHLGISLLLKGSVLEHTSNYTILAKSGSVFIKPPGVFHSNAFPENARILSIRVMDWGYYKLRFKDIGIIRHGTALYYFLSVLRSGDKKRAISELKNSILDCMKIRESASIPLWLVKAKVFIETHYSESMQVAELAKEIGKHPGHLARTFKAYYGVDIKSYQTQIGLHHAISDIGTQKKNLTRIAQDCGFYDQSHFLREFKKMTQMLPRNAAKLLNV